MRSLKKSNQVSVISIGFLLTILTHRYIAGDENKKIDQSTYTSFIPYRSRQDYLAGYFSLIVFAVGIIILRIIQFAFDYPNISRFSNTV